MVAEYIQTHGASFFDEISEAAGLLPSQAEEALAELVALGIVNSDSFGGLRALLVPSDRRRPASGGRRRRRIALFGMDAAGRWALIRRQPLDGGVGIDGGVGPDGNAAIAAPLAGTRDTARGASATTAAERDAAAAAARLNTRIQDDETIEQVARTLLRRWGVVFWRLLAREADWLPPWRELLMCFRRLEARGEIRGGRFVAGFTGEQYAAPEAIGLLRDMRNQPHTRKFVSLSGADPLNLVGIVTPGSRLPALSSNRLLYRDGVPVALLAGGEVRFLEQLEPKEQWEAQNLLLRRHVPAVLADFA
jgi:ATP-dependent Lhr-like helicase